MAAKYPNGAHVRQVNGGPIMLVQSNAASGSTYLYTCQMRQGAYFRGTNLVTASFFENALKLVGA